MAATQAATLTIDRVGTGSPPNDVLPDNAAHTFTFVASGGRYDTVQYSWRIIREDTDMTDYGRFTGAISSGAYQPPDITADRTVTIEVAGLFGGTGRNSDANSYATSRGQYTFTVRHFGPVVAPTVSINTPSSIREDQTLQLTTTETGGAWDEISRVWSKISGGGTLSATGVYSPPNVLLRETVQVRVTVTVLGTGVTKTNGSSASVTATASFIVNAVSGVGDSTLQIGTADASGQLLNRSMRITQDLRGVGSASFNVRIGTVTPEEGQIVAVKMGTAGRVFVGVVRDASLQTADEYRFWAVRAVSYRTVLDRRVITLETTTRRSLSDLVLQLQTDVLLSEAIFVKGGQPTGPMIEPSLWSRVSVSRILDELMERADYYWRIDENKQLVYGPYSVEAAPSVLSEGDVLSLQTLRVEKTQEDYANEVMVEGGRNAIGGMVFVSERNNAEISARSTVEGGSGIHTVKIEDSSITTAEEAQQVALGALNRRAQVVTRVSFATDEDGYQVGQSLTTNLPTFGVTGAFLIERVGIRDLDKGKPRYTIHARSAGVLQNLGTYIRDLKKK